MCIRDSVRPSRRCSRFRRPKRPARRAPPQRPHISDGCAFLFGEGSVTGTTLCPRRTLLLPCPQFVHRWWINCGNLCPRADHLVSMNTEPMESIIYGSRYSAGRLSLADRWIRAKEDPDIRVVRDRFEAFVQVGSVVTVTGVAVEDPQSGRLVKPQESDQTWPNGGRSGMTPGTSVRLLSTAANDPVSLRGHISAVLAAAADDFRRGAVPGRFTGGCPRTRRRPGRALRSRLPLGRTSARTGRRRRCGRPHRPQAPLRRSRPSARYQVARPDRKGSPRTRSTRLRQRSVRWFWRRSGVAVRGSRWRRHRPVPEVRWPDGRPRRATRLRSAPRPPATVAAKPTGSRP